MNTDSDTVSDERVAEMIKVIPFDDVRAALTELQRRRATPPAGKSHYCFECNRQWFGDDPNCPERLCPFRSLSEDATP